MQAMEVQTVSSASERDGGGWRGVGDSGWGVATNGKNASYIQDRDKGRQTTPEARSIPSDSCVSNGESNDSSTSGNESARDTLFQASSQIWERNLAGKTCVYGCLINNSWY